MVKHYKSYVRKRWLLWQDVGCSKDSWRSHGLIWPQDWPLYHSSYLDNGAEIENLIRSTSIKAGSDKDRSHPETTWPHHNVSAAAAPSHGHGRRPQWVHCEWWRCWHRWLPMAGRLSIALLIPSFNVVFQSAVKLFLFHQKCFLGIRTSYPATKDWYSVNIDCA